MANLTDDEKARFGPMLQQTYEAIAADANLDDIGAIIEFTCDANLPEIHGGMSRSEYERLLTCYSSEDTQSWLRTVLNY